MNVPFHALFYYTSRQLFECINNSVATAYTSLLILRIALTVLHIKRYVTTFSSCHFDTHFSKQIGRN